METEIGRGDIIQVPKEALLVELSGDIFGLVVSSPFLAKKAGQYVVALIAEKSETPDVEVEITEGPFRRKVVACSLLVNVLDDQIAELPDVNRVRATLEPKDMRAVTVLLRRIFGFGVL